MTKLEEIYVAVLPEMAAHNIEDTPQNRLQFLTGIRDAWLEDGSVSFVKWLYLITIGNEIIRLSNEIASK